LHKRRQYTIKIETDRRIKFPDRFMQRFGRVEGAKILGKKADGSIISQRLVNLSEQIYAVSTSAGSSVVFLLYVFRNSCKMAALNLENCFGHLQPACGGCLWGQELITCPCD